MKNNSFNELCMNRIQSSLTKKSSHLSSEYSLSNPNILYKIGQLNSSKGFMTSETITPHYRRKAYKRGQKIERNYYQELMKDLQKIQNSISHLKSMNEQEIFDYKQTYIVKFLKTILGRLQQECEQKSNFMKKLWQIFLAMFQNLFDRIINEIKKNEKLNLQNSLNVHKAYQDRIQKLENIINSKVQKQKGYESVLQNISNQYKEKKKKNKQLAEILMRVSQNLIENEEKVSKMTQMLTELLIKERGEDIESVQNYISQKFSIPIMRKEKIVKRCYEIKNKERRKIPKDQTQILSEIQIANDIENFQINQPENSDCTKKLTKNYKVQVNFQRKKCQKDVCNFFDNDEKYRNSMIENKQIQTLPVIIQGHKKMIDQYTEYQNEDDTIKKNENSALEIQNKIFFQKQNDTFNEKLSYASSQKTYKSSSSSSQAFQIQNVKEFSEQSQISIHSSSEKQIKFEMKQSKRRKVNKMMITKSKKKFQPRRSSVFAQQLSNHRDSLSKNSYHRRESIKPHRNQQQLVHKTSNSKTSFYVKKSSKFLEKDVVPLKKETIRKNQISLRLKSKEDEEEININTLQFKDLLSKLENLKVGLLIDETVKILLENSLLQVKKKSLNKNEKTQQIRDKLKNRNCSRNNRISHISFSLRQITKILVKVFDKGFIKLKNNSENIVMLELLKQYLEEQYLTLREDELENKILNIVKSIEIYTINSFLMKNFILLSSIEETNWSSIIFSSDTKLYFILLKNLSIQETFSIENSYTTIERLKDVISNTLFKVYRNQSLIVRVQKQVEEKLQWQEANTKLDIYKCCQLIIENVLKFKIKVLKSLTNIIYLPQISQNGVVTEEILKNILDFLSLSKLKYLNIVNSFRQKFCCAQKYFKTDLTSFVNFCLEEGIPDFDSIILYNAHFYELPQEVDETQVICHEYFNKNNKIADAFYKQKFTYKDVSKLCLGTTLIVEKESTRLLQQMLGEDLRSMYLWTTCKLQRCIQ